MKDKLQRAIGPFAPFIIMGISIACFIGLLLLLSYLLIWGILIGCILWLLIKIKNALFPIQKPATCETKEPTKGRIIEHHKD